MTKTIKVKELKKLLIKEGFQEQKHKSSYRRWTHPDGRVIKIPDHGCTEIGGKLFQRIIKNLHISLFI